MVNQRHPEKPSVAKYFKKQWVRGRRQISSLILIEFINFYSPLNHRKIIDLPDYLRGNS